MEQLIDWFGFELLKLFRARLGGVCWEGPEAWSLKASHDSNHESAYLGARSEELPLWSVAVLGGLRQVPQVLLGQL